MEYDRVLKWGTAFLVLAVALRLLSAGFFRQPEAENFLLSLETGRYFHFAPLPEAQQPSTEPDPPAEEDSLSFTEAALLPVQNHTAHDPDLFGLLTRPLSWHAPDAGPAVLIVHSHATETYTGEDIPYSGTYRTLETEYNMVSIGAEIARVLRSGGICVVHDTSLHDHPDYNSAYGNSRKAIQAYLQKYPSIRMVLDIHRDASGTAGGELITSATAGGQRTAQLMMVVGTKSEKWQENLSLALKLSALLEQENPGICRPVDIRKERFNVDLSVGSLLVEVGATGNTHGEAVIAANALAQSILELLADHGS